MSGDGAGAIGRRALIQAAAGVAAAPALLANASAATQRKPAPKGFLWGAAISAHQSEGNNTNSDAWLAENIRPTLFKERSGDACDSYHRYDEDFALAETFGFNCYRLGIEWARIEPSEGHFSNAELDHYARVLTACRKRGLAPVVTLSHFTVPLWFARRGGFEASDAPQLFARYCRTVAERLGGLMHLVTTFNEANIGLLVALFPQSEAGAALQREAQAALVAATGAPKFSRLAFADPAVTTPIMQQAHRLAYEAIKAARPELPVGITLTTQDIQSVGAPSLVADYERRLYGDWVDVARSHADFFGVQCYTRLRFDEHGMVAPPQGAELTLSGYEFYPQALADTIRWAHRTIGKPIYVTESGVAVADDARRIAFIDRALDGVRKCLDEGISVHSYIYWSLLDNFEWTSGYAVPFGLAAVDRQSFRRTPRPSAFHFAAIARANLI
ncbi:glycoside hydrolase family 1 protein [Sphingopyxis sp. DBS4]|uniref:glycoside hydrolase family 1 protein n=1 Tax=Sphingopyxis sp. DBS4 TaxID=2968500 RepID=UPI00214C96F6|nr:family 1 glycosylhydrolase [Sphingopyxis sp. DBS4]